MENVNIIAVAGRNKNHTKAFAREFDIDHWTCDYQKLLEDREIDAVSVCLHNHLHSPVSIDALEAGKHVYCEKPIARTYAEGLAMVESAKKNNRILSIQLSTLFSKETKAAKHAIDNGWIGKPFYAHSNFFRRRGRPYVDGYGTPAFVQHEKAGGGALLDTGVYHLGQILFLLDNPTPISVSGQNYQMMPMNQFRKKASGYNVEEVSLGFIRTEGNITITLAQAWAIHLDQICGSYLVASKGGIRLDPFELFRYLCDLNLTANAHLDDFEFRLKSIRGQNDYYDSPQKHFIAAIRGEVPLMPSAEITLNASLISEGIYLSSQKRREVLIKDIMDKNSCN
jgi:predicted dehydrogenase